jgi:GntR family transcriptional regulator, rspAB operon transcriptional repressor
MQPSFKALSRPTLSPQNSPLGRQNGGAVRQPRLTVARSIYLAMREDILGLKLRPGSALVEKALIERFECSRTPLREALIRLAEEQLVVIYPQSGTYVSRISLSALPSAVVVRQALECAAIEHAVSRMDQTAAARLDAVVARQIAEARTGNLPGFHSADEDFHAAIAEIAGHPQLWTLAVSAKSEIDRCRRLTLPVPGRMDQVIKEHQSIIACLKAGDTGQAVSAMRRHLSAVVPDAASLAKQHPDYFI